MRGLVGFIVSGCLALSVKAQPLDEVLAQRSLKLQLRFNQYDTSRYNLLVNRHAVDVHEQVETAFLGSRWKVQRQVEPAALRGHYHHTVRWRCGDGIPNNAALSVDALVNNWSAENYVIMPSAVYNGNRYPAVKMKYMPFFNDPPQLGLNNPILLSDQPRLNYLDGPSRIQLWSGSMAFPSLGYRNQYGQGFCLFMHQGNSQGDYGIKTEAFKGRNKAVISVEAPVVREGRKRWLYTTRRWATACGCGTKLPKHSIKPTNSRT